MAKTYRRHHATGVDAATREVMVTAADRAKVFGISEAQAEEQAEALGGGKPIP
jgi:hypothetical protein